MHISFTTDDNMILWDEILNPFPRTGLEIMECCLRESVPLSPEAEHIRETILRTFYRNPKVYPPNPDVYYYVLPRRIPREPEYVLIRDEIRSPRIKNKSE